MNPVPFGKQGSRSHSRMRVFLPARIACGSGYQAATLVNLSLSGAGLQCLSLPLGQRVVLEWCGYGFAGEICWNEVDRCGVCFDEPLPGHVFLETRAIEAERARHSAHRPVLRAVQ